VSGYRRVSWFLPALSVADESIAIAHNEGTPCSRLEENLWFGTDAQTPFHNEVLAGCLGD
jgi:hypothetical protein